MAVSFCRRETVNDVFGAELNVTVSALYCQSMSVCCRIKDIGYRLRVERLCEISQLIGSVVHILLNDTIEVFVFIVR